MDSHGARDVERPARLRRPIGDRKSTRLNSSHVAISYAVFCFKKKKLCSGNVGSRTSLRVGLSPTDKWSLHVFALFSFNNTATAEIYTLSLHDALPISSSAQPPDR